MRPNRRFLPATETMPPAWIKILERQTAIWNVSRMKKPGAMAEKQQRTRCRAYQLLDKSRGEGGRLCIMSVENYPIHPNTPFSLFIPSKLPKLSASLHHRSNYLRGQETPNADARAIDG